ncbi:MAG: hypothetical protein U0174_06855 [Polyangiaceae bacterium]
MRLQRIVVSVVVTGALVVLGAACKPKLGGACKPGKDSCIDSKTAMHCGKDNTYVQVKCAGTLGCLKFGSRVSCDDSVAEDGDACMGDSEEEYACNKGKKKAVVCRDGKFTTHLDCKGPKGCSMIGKMLNCDTTLADKGDNCSKPGTYACATDNKQMFICSSDKKWDVWRYCRGRDACQVKNNGNEVNCDVSISEENDPCGVPNAVACSVDGKKQLICRGGKFVQERECKKNGCTLSNTKRIDCS